MVDRALLIDCDHGDRRRAIVQSLLTEVFQGGLRAGQRLITRELADRFGVSHTPVREALIELAGTNVIELVPNRGAVVRRVTKQDVREVCQVRRALESEATRSACGRIDLAELQDIAKGLRRLATAKSRRNGRFLEQARALDSRLHDSIATSCGNEFLANELERLKTLFRAFRDVTYQHNADRNDHRQLAEEAKEHLAIVEALLNEDRKAAVRAMAKHIWSGVKHWSRALPEERSRQPAEKRRPRGAQSNQKTKSTTAGN